MRTIIAMALFALAANAHATEAETVGNPQPAAGTPVGTGGPVWRAPAAILYTNGSFVSQPTGGGPGGNDPVSVLTAPDTTFGGTCNNPTFRLADDFTVPAGGWTVQKITVFGYQTQTGAGGSTVSTMTGGFFRIWNGPPNVGTSTVVFGDVTTNRQTATSWSGVWRVSSTTLTNLQRPIMAVEMGNLNVPLAAGNYWLEWGITGSTASGPFCPPNTTVSASNNALQFNVGSSTWVAFTDQGSMRPLDFPFVIEGVLPAPDITPNTPPGPVALGNFAPGGPVSQAFTFTNAATATASGTVSCTLSGAPAGLTLTPAGTQTIAPGASATFTLGGTAPTMSGPFTGTITCNVEGISQPVVYNLSGVVGVPPSITPTVPPGPVALGSFLPGGSVTRVFGFTNAATATLDGSVTCTLSGAPAGLTLTPATAQPVAPGATVNVTLGGTAPTALGPFTGTITCTGDGIATPIVYTISGNVVSAPQAVTTIGPLAQWLLLLGLFAIGLSAVRRLA